jgi:hypothetical protein
MRYQVWYGYAIARFDDKTEAEAFATEHDGVVIDSEDNRVAR